MSNIYIHHYTPITLYSITIVAIIHHHFLPHPLILQPQRFHEALALQGIHTGPKGAHAGEDVTLSAQNVLGLG